MSWKNAPRKPPTAKSTGAVIRYTRQTTGATPTGVAPNFVQPEQLDSLALQKRLNLGALFAGDALMLHKNVD